MSGGEEAAGLDEIEDDCNCASDAAVSSSTTASSSGVSLRLA